MNCSYFKIAINNIIKNKSKTVITIISICIAVCSVCIISAVGATGQVLIKNELNQLGANCITVGINGETSGIPLNYNQVEIIKSNKNVKDVTPIITKFAEIKLRGYISKSVVWGIDESAKDIVSLKTLYGTNLTKENILAKQNVCVVDKHIANMFYGRDNVVGKKIDILINNNYITFDIIGVAQTGGSMAQNLMGGYIPSFVYIPCTTMQKYLLQQEYDKIAFTLNENSNEDLSQKIITSQLSEEIGINNAYVSQNLNSSNQEIDNITKLVSQVLTAIAGISLIVATLSVMTIMFSAVKERTKEIGIKKAIGASRTVILSEFAAEIFTLGFIGSIIGNVLAFILLTIFGALFKVDFQITISLMLKFSAITIALSMLFGIYPAYKASKLNAVDALRYN